MQPAIKQASKQASQSVMQPASQPVSHAASQPTMQPGSHAAMQPAMQPVMQPASHAASHAASYAASHAASRPCSQPTRRWQADVNGQLIRQLIFPLVSVNEPDVSTRYQSAKLTSLETDWECSALAFRPPPPRPSFSHPLYCCPLHLQVN